ncbi:MAG: carbohydrate porin [Burkholderiales bacterium]|nr:carbohydrate porin [Burkholderiales bacterium]
MLNRLNLKPLAVAVTLACAASAASSATANKADLARLLEKLNQRVEKLEQRNAELENQLRASRAPAANTTAAAALAQRVQTLETQQAQVERGLEKESISEREPDLTARLKLLESQAVNAQSAVRKVGAFDGVSAGFSLTTVAQTHRGIPAASSQLNYRGDAYVSLPLAKIGDIEHKVYAQFRLGQGQGLNDAPSFAKPNASAFRVQSTAADDAVAVLGQAWYQADIPLPFGGYKPHSKETLELNFGKMDPFVFFDQNAAAGDETRQFLNTIFVHNPLLDAGGDIGVDANGFAPGFRLSYVNASAKPQTWRVSLGVFGAGVQGANYQRSLSAPLVMLQAETEQRLMQGLAGNYRVYAWRNPQAAHYDAAVAGPEQHSGWGMSADQRVGDGVTVFGRYGHQLQGHVSFDRALTLGAEFNGSYWGRGGDRMGVALGWLKISQDYRAFSGTASGAEKVGEWYYRWRINSQFELSPNFQYFGNPAGEGGADAIKVLGLRAQISY